MTRDNEKKAAQQAALLEAARQGHYQQLESILGQLQQLKARKKKSNPLASLRKSEVSLNRVRDPVTGFTCLHHAALNGHTKCVQLILDCGAKLNALDYKGSSALHLAAWVGNLDVIRLLLQQRPTPSSTTATQPADTTTGGGSPLNSDHGGLAVDVNLCNNDNQTPLSLAAQFGHVQVARELLEHGASLDLRSHQLDSPLDLASLNGRLEMVDLLLESSPKLVAELRQAQAIITLDYCSLNNRKQLTHNPSSDADTSSSALCDAHQQQQQRPATSGWSSLLRGRRESTPTGKSPLQRLTVGTLSMRQAGAGVVGRKYTGGETAPTSNGRNLDTARRRATLTSGINSFDQIYSPTQGGRYISSQVHRASLSIYQDANSSEILLDHSPMHYAARRGHANVLALLFNKYQANILQVTSLGSILHELALNNHTRHIDVLKLVFKYIAKKPNCVSVVNSLLELVDSHGQTVFDILRAMNNKSALEMTRSIQECSDHLRALYSANHSSNIIQHYGTLMGGSRAAASRASYQMSDAADTQQFASLRRKRPALIESQQNTFHAAHMQSAGAQAGYRFNQQSATSSRREDQENQHPAPSVITRSVSNLNRVSSFQHKQPRRELTVNEQQIAEQDIRRSTGHCMEADSGIESAEVMRQTMSSRLVNPRIMSQAAHMVRSQTDSSYLFQTSKPAPLEGVPPPEQRATINRGYHVYQHEFYPPRLLPNCRNYPAPGSGLNDELRQTTSLDMASSATSAASNARLQAEEVRGSRFMAAAPPPYQEQAYSQQQQHKSQHQMILDTGLESQLLRQSNSSLNNSQSYDGHLGSHMFENARQAIMRDFDKMIGKELLNRNHCDIIKGVQVEPNAHHQTDSSSSLQLSKVQLDMDNQGDRLTVSGLMVLPASNASKLLPPKPTPPSHNSLPPVAGTRSNTSHTTRTSSSSSSSSAAWMNHVMASPRDDIAPPKPPRLSLLNRNSAILSSSRQPPPERPPPPPSSEMNNNNINITKPPQAQELQQMLQILPHQHHTKPSDIKPTHRHSGLLKVATQAGGDLFPSALMSQQHRTGLAQDTDSGICTSHSPASLTTTETTSSVASNQQRSAVVRHLTRPQLPPTQNHHTTESSPPSPNTAQHCIEEVLQMQQPTKHSSSSLSAAGRRAPYSLESWFLRRDRSSPHNDADYENCIGLQRQLQRTRSLACLMVPPAGDSSPSLDSVNERRLESALSSDTGTTSSHPDEDDEDYASSSNQSSKNCSDSCNSSSEVQLPMKQTKKCKEVLLRVIIDENEVHSDDGELFYVNPSKIAVKRPQADAETITDEELCATLDEESGSIRFSLRRRCDTNNRLERSSLLPPTTSEDCSSISSKKSRLSVQQAVPTTKQYHQLQEPNNNNRVSSPEPSSASATPLSDQSLPTRSSDSHQHRFYNKQEALALERWFMSSNLVGLAEYSPKFVNNGYDNIKFLNNNKLMNEDCLNRIGIKDESHQLLILEKIRTSLAPVDFNLILPKDVLDKLNLEEFLKSLQLSHLQPLVQALYNEPHWKDAILQMSDKFPEGTRRRISEALDHVRELEKNHETSPKSRASATSSSSKDSIESIVSRQTKLVDSQTAPVIEAGNDAASPVAAAPQHFDDVANKQIVKPLPQQTKVSPFNEQEISKSLVSIKAQLRPVAAARRSSNAKPEVQESPKKVASQVSVKSVCWPPKSNGQLWSATSQPSADSNKPSQIVNNQQYQLINTSNNRGRSGKPAPPAKPPKLVAPKPIISDQTAS